MRFTALALTAALALATAPALAEDAAAKPAAPALLGLGVGYVDVFDTEHAASLHVDYRPETRWGPLAPIMGGMITSRGSAYAFAGIGVEIPTPFEQVQFFPSFGAGLYAHGDGKDLGYPVEFRSSIEIQYLLENQGRVIAGIQHLSNASLGDDNQGTEIVSVHYAMPVDSLFGN